MRELTGDTVIRIKVSIEDRKARPENSISPDGKKIKKNGKWVNLRNSTFASKKINPEIWGTEKEVRAKAKTTRHADSFKKATECLREIANHSMIKPLESADGLKAELSSGKIKKILSGKSVDKSFDLKAHLEAAANADHLFRNSIEVIEPQPDTKGDRGIKAFHYTYAPMEWEGKIIPVKFTVREYEDTSINKKLYSIEAIDFDYYK